MNERILIHMKKEKREQERALRNTSLTAFSDLPTHLLNSCSFLLIGKTKNKTNRTLMYEKREKIRDLKKKDFRAFDGKKV